MELMRSDWGELPWITPHWPVDRAVQAFMTTRNAPQGLGHSRAPFDGSLGRPGFNLGLGSGEAPQVVERNRRGLNMLLGMEVRWLHQVHGCLVAKFDLQTKAVQSADASWTDQAGVPLAVLVADCLPVLFADRSARVVAAAHAGWRGLAAGVLEATVRALPVPAEDLVAFVGPAIGPAEFEVGGEVVDACTATDPGAVVGFRAGQPGKWFGNLDLLARRRLAALGVTAYGEATSTFSDAQRFYSFRRDKVTGRMAAVIWIAKERDGPHFTTR